MSSQCNRCTVILQIGPIGRVHHERLFAISPHPDNPNFADSLANGVHPAGAAFQI